jgi:ornithine cyclodeaminase/alanine dehydrogenase-like protein (mu-crystallin family)
MILLDATDVRRLLPMADAVDLMRHTLTAFSGGGVRQPMRHMVDSPGDDVLAVMPAHVSLADRRGFGLKAVSICPHNPARGLPAHVGFVMVFDPATGQPAALVSGAAVTAVRTAAASAAATDVLAGKDAEVLAILGAGVQARSHLDAMAVVRPLAAVRVWNHRRPGADAFAEWARGHVDCPVEVFDSVASATDGADLICTATSAAEPVLCSADVADGAHINAVGSSFPTARELAGDLVGRCRIVVDSVASARQEAGDLLAAADEGYLDLADVRVEVGEVLAGTRPGRGADDEVTLFESLGLAAEDVATGLELYHRAVAGGHGRRIDFADE